MGMILALSKDFFGEDLTVKQLERIGLDKDSKPQVNAPNNPRGYEKLILMDAAKKFLSDMSSSKPKKIKKKSVVTAAQPQMSRSPGHGHNAPPKEPATEPVRRVKHVCTAVEVHEVDSGGEEAREAAKRCCIDRGEVGDASHLTDPLGIPHDDLNTIPFKEPFNIISFLPSGPFSAPSSTVIQVPSLRIPEDQEGKGDVARAADKIVSGMTELASLALRLGKKSTDIPAEEYAKLKDELAKQKDEYTKLKKAYLGVKSDNTKLKEKTSSVGPLPLPLRRRWSG